MNEDKPLNHLATELSKAEFIPDEKEAQKMEAFEKIVKIWVFL